MLPTNCRNWKNILSFFLQTIFWRRKRYLNIEFEWFTKYEILNFWILKVFEYFRLPNQCILLNVLAKNVICKSLWALSNLFWWLDWFWKFRVFSSFQYHLIFFHDTSLLFAWGITSWGLFWPDYFLSMVGFWSLKVAWKSLQ